ncbi:MAG: M10 family metallopeptidase C-terminal domain-containing protein [Proteobacteria bacterium]|nr:M10 family metallopeptidase C-terminal domain-containing protein [Pseudomonadota bacterium]
MAIDAGEAAARAGGFAALGSSGAPASGAAAAATAGVAPSGNVFIDSIIFGSGRWSGLLTYSFPSDANAAFGGVYAVAVTGFQQVSATQIAAVQAILEGSGNAYGSVESVTNLGISRVADNTFRASVNLQISQSDFFGGANLPTAWVGDFPGSPIFPGFPDAQGDVWFGDDSGNGGNDHAQGFRNPVPGNYYWATHIHELGHALGLKHAHDPNGASAPFDVALPPDRDSLEFSVMSYRSYVGGSTASGYSNEQFGYAQTLMMYDILALQYLYGANYATNGGDTNYAWSPATGEMFVNGAGQGAPGANRIFLTIWDGGGIDTYDLRNYTTAVSIDLRPQSWSVASDAQRANLDVFQAGHLASGNIYNSALFNGDLRSLIENAYGGSGSDVLIGNQANNTLIGFAGNDIIRGEDGDDVLIGGLGDDRIEGGNGNDYLIGLDGNDTLIDGAGINTLQGGIGNDIYAVQSNADTVFEFANEGRDQIQTFLSYYVLPPNVEDLIFVGAGSHTGIGTSADNWLIGGSGNDYLIGLAGNDVLIDGAGLNTLQGGAGNDIYAVQSVNDTVFEFANEGIDEVQTFLASYALRLNVENLVFVGNFAHVGIGTVENNRFTGAGGNDTFTGAGGADIFDFRLAANGGSDFIVDFDAADASPGHDLIDLTGRGMSFASLALTSVSGGTQVAFGGNTFVLLAGIDIAQVNAFDFLL